MRRVSKALIPLALLLPGCGKVDNGTTAGAEDTADDGSDSDDGGDDGGGDDGEAGDSDGDGWTEEEGDCDDSDDDVYPGHPECNGDNVDNDCDAATPDQPEDTAAPVLVSLVVENGGLHEFGNGPVPSVLLTFHVTDDVDFPYIDALIWYDDAVDGAVDTGGEPAHETSLHRSGDCFYGELDAELSVQLPVGDKLDYATTYDFALVARDGQSYRSEPLVVSATTPDEDGEDAR